MVGKLHTYSPQNTLLIMAQRPDATQVMGYGDKEGRTYELAPDPSRDGLKHRTPPDRRTSRNSIDLAHWPTWLYDRLIVLHAGTPLGRIPPASDPRPVRYSVRGRP